MFNNKNLNKNYKKYKNLNKQKINKNCKFNKMRVKKFLYSKKYIIIHK